MLITEVLFKIIFENIKKHIPSSQIKQLLENHNYIQAQNRSD